MHDDLYQRDNNNLLKEYEAIHESIRKNMEQFMKTSRIRKRRTLSNFTVLMKHVDPFYRVGFDDATQNHVLKKISKDVGRI